MWAESVFARILSFLTLPAYAVTSAMSWGSGAILFPTSELSAARQMMEQIRPVNVKKGLTSCQAFLVRASTRRSRTKWMWRKETPTGTG